MKLMRGIVDSLPFSLTVGTLGVVFGATAGSAGLGNLTAILMSLLVFSGSAQFAALGLWRQNATALLLTTTLLSTRFLLMSASLAARLPRIPTWLRTLLGFGVTDESYALSVTRGAKGAQVSVPYLAGCMLAIYVPWVLGTGLGIALGPVIPTAWVDYLTVCFPLVFLILTILCTDTVPKAVVALIGASLSVVMALYLPPGWNVVAAGLAASLIGPLIESAKLHRRPAERRLGDE